MTSLINDAPAIVAALAVGGVLLFIIAVKLLSRPKTDPHLQGAKCLECGWAGQVSRYAGRCPGCNAPLGDLKARK